MVRMAVSDDSKLKLIAIKHNILYEMCKRIDDKQFEKLLFVAHLKCNHQTLYDMLSKYDKQSIQCDIDYDNVYKLLFDSVYSKCVHLYQLITGGKHIANEQQLADQLIIVAKNLSEQLREVEILNEKFERNFEDTENLYLQYLELCLRYYNNYKIPFKLISDEMNCNLLMSKAQTLCVRKRLEETEFILQKYGNKETIDALKEERKALEKEEKELKIEVNNVRSLLEKYENLDSGLIKEYKKLKSDLECRYWALNELNQSSGSTSNGSLSSPQ